MFEVYNMLLAYLEKLQTEYLDKNLAIEKEEAALRYQLKENLEFTKRLEEEDDSSYELFTPRSTGLKNKEELQKLKSDKKLLTERLDQKKILLADSKQKLEELTNVIKEARSAMIRKEDYEEIDQNRSRLILLETQENERQRISRELHDSTVQNLTGLVHKADLCTKLIDIDPIRCKLELSVMAKTLRDNINDIRAMIYDLRPMSFDDIGLEITIERAIDKIKSLSEKEIDFEVEGEPYEIKPVIGITILRIIQEACNNAVKYSEASTISVLMTYRQNEILLEIEDNGKGFDVECVDVKERKDNSGFGLSIMKERVYLLSGEIKIESEINKGTKITVNVPISEKETEEE